MCHHTLSLSSQLPWHFGYWKALNEEPHTCMDICVYNYQIFQKILKPGKTLEHDKSYNRGEQNGD